MATIKTGIYDFSQVLLLIKHKNFAGQINIDGFMPDTEISVERDDPRWARNGSGDGKATTFVRNPDNSGTISFTLNQSTDSLDKMNAICQYSNVNRTLNILFETTLVDKSSRTIYFSPESLASFPNSVSFGSTESGREFQIICGHLQENLGGSSAIPQDTLAILNAFNINVDASWTVLS